MIFPSWVYFFVITISSLIWFIAYRMKLRRNPNKLRLWALEALGAGTIAMSILILGLLGILIYEQFAGIDRDSFWPGDGLGPGVDDPAVSFLWFTLNYLVSSITALLRVGKT